MLLTGCLTTLVIVPMLGSRRGLKSTLFPPEIKLKHKTPEEDRQFVGQDLNSRPWEYEAGVPNRRPRLRL
jgi:hypothetical protein